MGKHDTPRMADAFGVPTYYVTDIVREDAGAGNVRITNCQMRNGILIPQCEIIVPSSRLLPIGQDVSAFASDVHLREHRKTLMRTGSH